MPLQESQKNLFDIVDLRNIFELPLYSKAITFLFSNLNIIFDMRNIGLNFNTEIEKELRLMQ